MEGYLNKWVNVFKRWQLRYFILNDDVLIYCDHKLGPTKGSIHLKVAGIILVPEDPLRIIINTGTSEINLRAQTITEKINWVNALKAAQDKCLDNVTSIQYDQRVQELLSDVWITSAAFDETLSLLTPKVDRQQKDLCERLESLGRNLRDKVTQCASLIEQQRQILREDNQTVFESFADRSIAMNSLQESIIQSSEPLTLSLQEILNKIKLSQPIKYSNIYNNPVFQRLKLTNNPTRDKLPFRKDPNEKLNILQLCKELIGKDMTRFSVPIILNEPLSMLQRLSEQLEYHACITKADQIDDSCLRMCYIMGFGVGAYAGNIDRMKKPFNPILGETFELVLPEFKFVSEQVSHHPPISAGYAEAPHFKFWTNSDIHTKFYGTNFTVNPLGLQHVVLKRSGDHYSYNKCTTKVQNILWGTQYIDHMGDMKFTCTNGDSGILTLIEKNNRETASMKGIVKDKNGQVRYTLRGNWNDKLIAINSQTNQEIIVWTRHALPSDAAWNYFFTSFAMQLNHLTLDMIQTLPTTDCRLRPDQIAMENGWVELASQEKHRLEEKQRVRRKVLANQNEHHSPKYFEECFDQQTNEKWFKYKGNYFDSRRGNQEGLDLF